MLLAEPAQVNACKHHQCLDLLHVTVGKSRGFLEEAIVLEVWETGALLQTSNALVPGTSLALTSGNRSVRARVTSSAEDDFGYLSEVSVDSTQSWFPRGYRPHYLHSDRE